ncbi:hypothetical protein OE88DRAFT_1402673 [Heliocybe sulcata]|uniref:Uncharacterized protein n=1 Tax=Heliocybe sulcata TaxID=5364 RepID=A0A5C3N4U0_9AGAM|nr:hypothetical protein OE88DRAFT_1402673 [Heliocybe sulcata]
MRGALHLRSLRGRSRLGPGPLRLVDRGRAPDALALALFRLFSRLATASRSCSLWQLVYGLPSGSGSHSLRTRVRLSVTLARRRCDYDGRRPRPAMLPEYSLKFIVLARGRWNVH